MFLLTLIILCMFCTMTNGASISSGTCSVPSSHRLVAGLETQLENSVSQQTSPDPSVLIALNLAEDKNLSVKEKLVQQIKETAGKEMTSGKVALYVLALRSSCENPNNVATTPEKNVNLVHVLEEKTKEEIKHLDYYGTLKTTYYQLALDTLALCVEKNPEVEMAAVILAKAALRNDLQSGGHFFVDTGAMASLALTCVYNENIMLKDSKLMNTFHDALTTITKQILGAQKSDGIIGNIYSTGLAMQALSVTSDFYSAGDWSCQKTLDTVLKEADQGAFNNPAAASQILPSLVGKTYLDVRSLTCPPENVPVSTITVFYTITNELVGNYFSYPITVKVPKGSVLLAVLEEAQRTNPSKFSFQTENTSYGPMVISINNIHASTNERTYWQFLSGKKPLEQGVGSYKPVDNEEIEAIFSEY
ncbi:cobalamin binding intrinsic factor [Elgaria multicarinata webbii]|uniref:cobalamin binding intrinsic factor n=1 Tax=Elgaria multicarinata webbii TaxID=159646 RepID=UPI002FCD4D69